MAHILEDFSAITSQAPGKVVALGNVYREASVGEQVKGGFFASLFGSAAKNAMEADRWRYLVLTDQNTAHVLDFAKGDLQQRDDIVLAATTVSKVHSDESWLILSFQHAGKDFHLKLHRYQLPDLEGGLLGDTEEMKQVGVMTKALEAAFRART